MDFSKNGHGARCLQDGLQVLVQNDKIRLLLSPLVYRNFSSGSMLVKEKKFDLFSVISLEFQQEVCGECEKGPCLFVGEGNRGTQRRR